MNKLNQIIELLSEDGQLTAMQLSSRLQVSVRTIKNYVKQLNLETPGLIQSTNRGYRLSKEVTRLEKTTDTPNFIPQTVSERQHFIIKLLLRAKTTEPFNIYDIAEELFVSESTLRNDLKRVKRKLRTFDLVLEISGDYFHLTGTEQNIRRMLSSVIYEESNASFINIHSLKDAFPNTDLYLIRSIIQLIFQENHYFINDYSLTNLVLHLALSIERIKDSNQPINQPLLSNHDTTDYRIASKIAKQLELTFHVTFSEVEVYEIALLIASRATSLNFKTITSENIEKFVGTTCLSMSKKLIQKIKNVYSIDLSRSEFFVRFTLHLFNLQIRSTNNYLSKNPLTQDIKMTYPFIYDIAVSLAQDLTTHYNIQMNDDEIAFIAFHIGSALETQKENKKKLATVVYCPEYYDLGVTLTTKIKALFEDQLLVKDLITDSDNLHQLVNIDLIISTVPLSSHLSIPSLETGIFPTPIVEEQLRKKIQEIQSQKRKAEIKVLLTQLISPQLFETNQQFSSKFECIHYMTQKFIAEGFVDQSFEEEILSREALSSTAFGSFAIPHSMNMEANKTGLNIILSSSAIPWDNSKVHLVLMMCFNKNERYIFNQIYETITMVLSDSDNILHILKSTNYHDFINRLVECI